MLKSSWKKREAEPQKRWEQLDEDFAIPQQLDRAVVTEQIRNVINAFREKLRNIPGRLGIPKTLIFAKTEAMRIDIIQKVREDFARAMHSAESNVQREEDGFCAFSVPSRLQSQDTVTGDMIATGTDVKPLECLCS
jgi:type I restriction enzyme R subunit